MDVFNDFSPLTGTRVAPPFTEPPSGSEGQFTGVLVDAEHGDPTAAIALCIIAWFPCAFHLSLSRAVKLNEPFYSENVSHDFEDWRSDTPWSCFRIRCFCTCSTNVACRSLLWRSWISIRCTLLLLLSLMYSLLYPLLSSSYYLSKSKSVVKFDASCWESFILFLSKVISWSSISRNALGTHPESTMPSPMALLSDMKRVVKCHKGRSTSLESSCLYNGTHSDVKRPESVKQFGSLTSECVLCMTLTNALGGDGNLEEMLLRYEILSIADTTCHLVDLTLTKAKFLH